ncbi:hypothetical protein TNCV_739901 [Trichonephila clavipes]|nr:hypothetical protein TNCV_739901 [Trichonephila clavipes]
MEGKKAMRSKRRRKKILRQRVQNPVYTRNGQRTSLSNASLSIPEEEGESEMSRASNPTARFVILHKRPISFRQSHDPK